jgi:lactobin A/cerein 7B family class IIb bacteriocin
MKNLEIMGVQEMNSQEMKKVDGGLWPALAALATLVLTVIALADEVKDYVDGVAQGFNETSNYHN